MFFLNSQNARMAFQGLQLEMLPRLNAERLEKWLQKTSSSRLPRQGQLWTVEVPFEVILPL